MDYPNDVVSIETAEALRAAGWTRDSRCLSDLWESLVSGPGNSMLGTMYVGPNNEAHCVWITIGPERKWFTAGTPEEAVAKALLAVLKAGDMR